MKPSEAKVLARRLRMFKTDPNCFWCGKLTVLYGEQSQLDLATIDHLYSRLHPERKKRYKAGHDRSALLHVLACYACNHKRGKVEQQGFVFVPDLESRREFARQVSAVNGIVTYRPEERPPMRVICTIEEALAYAREPRSCICIMRGVEHKPECRQTV